MNRREMLKLFAYGGMKLSFGSAATLALPKIASATNHERYWVFVSASGGWDVTNMWDPKGSELIYKGSPINKYSRDDIRQVGNIRYAPVPPGVITQDMLHTFTQKHYQKMLVLNGIDQGTNSHAVGERVSLSGSDGTSIPVAAAMLASPFAQTQSMAFIANGRYNYTAGIVPRTRFLSRGDYQQLNVADKFAGNIDVFTEINLQKRAMIQQLIGSNTRDLKLQAMQQFAEIKKSNSNVSDILSFLPEIPNSNNDLANAEMIAAAFKAGNSTSASFSIGGFDTHSNNDQNQFTQMDSVLTMVDYLWTQLEIKGIADKTTVVLTSDFARKPLYRSDSFEGKDHWPIASMVIMGSEIGGNRVVGATDEFQNALNLDPITLALSESGIKLNSASIYDALRRFSGLSGTAIDFRYPLNADYLNLFG